MGDPVRSGPEVYGEDLRRINDVKAVMASLSDARLDALVLGLREGIQARPGSEDLRVELFAAVREAARREIGLRPFDEQIGAGLALALGGVIEMPTGEEDLFDFFRAIVEGGSFARWVVEAHGWDAAWALRDGDDVEAATGTPRRQAEEEWLATIAVKDLQPKSCLLALPGNQVFRDVCQQLENQQLEREQ